jgi:hypothetical protein
MRSVWSLTIVPGCILATALLASCGDDGRGCNLDGVTAPCPNPIYGWARVDGFALRDDGTPVANERVLFVCPDGVGANDAATDSEGRFSVFLTYSVADTLLQPFPPRQPDGSFRVECQTSLVIAGDILATGDSFEIPFGPTENDVVRSEVALRLPPS